MAEQSCHRIFPEDLVAFLYDRISKAQGACIPALV